MNKINLNFWLYKSKINASGEAPVYLRVSDKSGKFEISTGVFAALKEWNSEKQKVSSTSTKASLANKKLQNAKEKIEIAITELLQTQTEIGIDDIRGHLNGPF